MTTPIRFTSDLATKVQKYHLLSCLKSMFQKLWLKTYENIQLMSNLMQDRTLTRNGCFTLIMILKSFEKSYLPVS